MEVPIQFHWKGRDGARQLGLGRTRDISTRGMFVYTDSPPPQDADVLASFSLDTSGEGVHGHTRARVLRLESGTPGKMNGGFATVNRSFALRRRTSK